MVTESHLSFSESFIIIKDYFIIYYLLFLEYVYLSFRGNKGGILYFAQWPSEGAVSL